VYSFSLQVRYFEVEPKRGRERESDGRIDANVLRNKEENLGGFGFKAKSKADHTLWEENERLEALALPNRSFTATKTRTTMYKLG